jgi:hypothetical protein
MNITTPKPQSFNRIARVRRPASRRRYHRARKAAMLGGRMTWRAAKLGVRAGESRAQLGHTRQAVRPMAARASGMVTGATIMYFLDPHAGRRRRHVARDRVLKRLRRSGRQASQKARYAAGVAEGKVHQATSGGQAKPQPDDTTLARKVESEIFRDADTPKGTVNVNAEEGVVYLRGYTDSQEWIDRLIADARAVEGVHEVRSLLHVAQTS